MEAADLHLVQLSTDASPEPGSQLPGNERKHYVLSRMTDVASSPYKKEVSHPEDLPDSSIVGSPQIMLPAIPRASPGLMAQSGS
jgi:hypothetical protein